MLIIEQIAGSRVMPDERGIHPGYFITTESIAMLSHYQRFKRYGISALYSAADQIPATVLTAFDIIANELDRTEYLKIKSMDKK